MNSKILSAWKRSGYRVFDVRITRKRLPKKLSYNFVEDAKKYDLSKLIKKVGCPIVIVHGDSDIVVPSTHANVLFSSANEPKELIFVSGVNHQYHGKNEKTLETIISENLLKYA